MKRVAVVCSNKAEWRFFCETLQWNLAKQDKKYTRVSEAIVDTSKSEYYFYCANNVYELDQQIYALYSDDFTIDKVIGMCDIESGVMDYLERWMYHD